MTGQTYPEYYSHLRNLLGKLGKELQGPMTGFAQLHKAALADGALSAKVKELFALAIAVSARCEGCIAFHTQSALKAGASRQEILEADSRSTQEDVGDDPGRTGGHVSTE